MFSITWRKGKEQCIDFPDAIKKQTQQVANVYVDLPQYNIIILLQNMNIFRFTPGQVSETFMYMYVVNLALFFS